MNQNQGKASSKVARAGLAKFRPLTPSDSTSEISRQSRTNLPNGWYFNENQEKTFWNEIEDSLAIELQEKIEQKTQRTDYQTQMEDTSTRLQTLVSQFDDIDQNTLLAMMEIADEGDNEIECDPNQFLDESKNQIVNFMTEMVDISEAQQSLVENLQTWFSNLLSNDSFLEHEKKEQPDEPNRKKVYDFLGSIINICSEKTEKAQVLHNDVSNFWKKQISTFKHIIYRKDEEISKLKTAAEKAEASSSKKKGKKQSERKKQNDEEMNLKNQQIEGQLRTIEEQKATIEKLRKDLQTSQASAAAAFIATSPQSEGQKNAGDNSNLSNFKAEAETKITLLNEQIAKLTGDNEKLNNLLSEERIKSKNFMKALEEKEIYIKELEANNQKNLQLLALEQEKVAPPPPVPEKPSEDDDRLLEIIQLQESIKLMKQQHQQELARQQETLRERFLVEKQKLLEASSSNGNGQMVKSIIDDYENKIKVQKEEFDKLIDDIVKSWGAKLDILTRQYENRIKALNSSHSTEIIGIRNNAQYELRKKEIQLEEDFNKRMLEESKQRGNKDELMKSKIDHLKVLLNYAKMENSKLRFIARSYSYKYSDIKKDFDAIPHHLKDDEEEEEEQNESLDLISNETKLIEKNLVQIQILREMTEEQTKWLLSKQKESFEKEMNQITEKHQIDIRALMLKIQDSLSKINIEGEDPISTDDALKLVADMYIAMNEQIEESEKLQTPTMTIEEANNRIKALSDQIQQLKLQISLKFDNAVPSDEKDSNEIAEMENQINDLKQKNKVLEDIQNGNNQAAVDSLMIMCKDLRKQIDAKDALINQLQQSKLDSNDSKYFEFSEFIIYHSENVYEDILQLEEQRNLLQRSMPDFLVLKDITSKKEPKPQIKSHILNSKMRRMKSQIFNLDLFKDEPFLKAQPEIVPVILQLKNGGITENQTNKLSLPSTKEGTVASSVTKISQQPSPSSTLNSPPKKPDMQVRTNINKENLGKEEPSAKFSGRFLVESSVQIDLNKPSIFTNIDSSKLIMQSGVNAYTIPPKFPRPPRQPIARGRRDLVYGIIIELQPAPPPTPLVIDPDKELLATIKELQDKLLEIERKQREEEQNENKESEKNAIRENMFTQMRIAIIDSSNKMIQKQKEIITKLQNRKPEVIYQTQIVRIPDVQLEPLEPLPNVNYDYDINKIKEKKKQKKPIHSNIQISSITSFDIYRPLPPAVHEETEQEKKEKLRKLYPPPVYDRPPPTPVTLDLISEIDDEDIDDPFTASIQVLGSIIRFISNFRDNENHILVTLQNDTNAYDAFLKATESDDESAFRFISQVKENGNCFSDNILQIEQLNQLELKLLNILKFSKKRANGMAQEISECRTAAAASELTSQQTMLKEAQNDKNIDPKKSNIIILQKLESSLEVISNLCIILSTEEQARLAVLTKRVKDYQVQLEQQKPVIQSNIDNLIESVQNFISSIKPANAKTLQEIISSATKAEIDELKSKIKSYKESVKKYKKKLSQVQTDNEHLNIQIKTLQVRLNEEKELNENAISLYQSQVAMLKSLFNTLNIDASKDPLGMAEAVRNEVLSLQSLLGTSSSERDALKVKVADLEDEVLRKDKHIHHLLNEYEEINKKNIELEETIVKYKEEMMFHNTDIDTLKKEKEADEEIGARHLMQLQEVIQMNQEANSRSHEIESKMNEMKDKIRNLKEENENLQIQVAISRYTSVKTPMTSIATQTILRLVGKKQKAEKNLNPYQHLKVYQQKESAKEKEPDVAIETGQQQQQQEVNQIPDQNQNDSEILNNSVDNNDELPSLKTTLNQNEQAVPDSTPPPQEIQQPSVNGKDEENEIRTEEEEFDEVADFEWEINNQSGDESDTFSAEPIQSERVVATPHKFYVDEKAPDKVHKPLHLKKYKKILSKISARPKTPATTTPKSTKSRPSTAQKSPIQSGRPQTAVSKAKATAQGFSHEPIQKDTNEEGSTLSIGTSIPGHRALPGQLGKIKPTVPGRTAIAMKAAFLQHPTQVIPLESAHNYKFNNANSGNVTSRPKKTFQNLPLSSDLPGCTAPNSPNFITEYNNSQPMETIRITRVEYSHNESNNKEINDQQNGPIVLPIERFKVSCDPMSVAGPIAKSKQPFDLAEFERMISKLQERNQELLKKLNKKDNSINDLKKKCAELFGEKQQCDIKLVRAMNTARRTEIRCEAVQTRLDILMKELNLRDDDNRELKKEIIRLKALSGPASSSLAAAKESQLKQMQLKKEKQKKKLVLIAAMSAIDSTTDKDVQKHLGKILENTQRSIARLEVKRRKFKEEERKQIYAALSAISLINDKKPESDYINRISFFDDENDANQNRAMKGAWNSKAGSSSHNSAKPIVFENLENSALNRKFPSYTHAMEMIDRIQPPLSVEERRVILRGDMTEEIAAKIEEFDKVDSIDPVLSGKKINF